ncbi:M20 family metallopeptidase [Fonticella tunisiensis]|uniref:Peptidase M20 domain-containing protein 2 n=1 Tax=Fonticella tunisiensis TaxID=1096341 RepID=A0A4R7KUW4_9CLOT|nr:M20 family metallopeptidase [Fonticella tunisiensis]TDT62297.1 amidohydrolase [Fonticella tunisiensis]
MKEKIKAKVSEIMGELEEISRFLYENPELGNQEFKAAEKLEGFLRRYGFNIEHGVYGIETAFKATYDSNKDGAKIAFLCEYDALPEIGHGCGHNLIAAMGVGAAVGLQSIIDEIGGSIVVFGTPAEETNGAKVKMAAEGAFNGITAAMLVHPSAVTKESGSSLAINAYQFEFFGKTAHASGCPEKGINALDAVIATFNNINALRQYIGKDARIHGIISKGGEAPNIIPDYAAAKFYVRAATKKQLKEISDRVIKCAEAGALAAGAKLKVSNFELSNDDLRTNSVLSETFSENLRALGEVEIEKSEGPSGSTDMGNVSYAAPSIHPYIGLGDKELVGHSREFAAATQSEKGKEALFKGACAMAMTGYDVIVSPELQQRIWDEFKKINE